METVFIGLGSNIGDGKGVLAAAWKMIGESRGLVTVSLSHPYVSSPVKMASRNWFTNCVGELRTDLSPRDLLAVLMKIETAFGRKRDVRISGHQDRTLDLDMLLYGDIELQSPDLVLPHPQIQERLFVLRPLAELSPDLWSKAHGKSIREMEEDLVRRIALGLRPQQDIFRENWN